MEYYPQILYVYRLRHILRQVGCCHSSKYLQLHHQRQIQKGGKIFYRRVILSHNNKNFATLLDPPLTTVIETKLTLQSDQTLDYRDSPHSLNGNSRRGQRSKIKKPYMNSRTGIYFNYFNPVSVIHRIFSFLPRIEASKLA